MDLEPYSDDDIDDHPQSDDGPQDQVDDTHDDSERVDTLDVLPDLTLDDIESRDDVPHDAVYVVIYSCEYYDDSNWDFEGPYCDSVWSTQEDADNRAEKLGVALEEEGNWGVQVERVDTEPGTPWEHDAAWIVYNLVPDPREGEYSPRITIEISSIHPTRDGAEAAAEGAPALEFDPQFVKEIAEWRDYYGDSPAPEFTWKLVERQPGEILAVDGNAILDGQRDDPADFPLPIDNRPYNAVAYAGETPAWAEREPTATDTTPFSYRMNEATMNEISEMPRACVAAAAVRYSY